MDFKLAMGILLTLLPAVKIYAQKALAEKPAFLNPCTLHSPELSECFSKNFQSTVSEWRAGVPGLKSIGGLDPLYVKRVGIQHTQSPLEIDVDLLNIAFTGLAGVSVKQSDYDIKKLTDVSTLLVPKFAIVSDYKMKGKILNFNLNANGKMQINVDDFLCKIYLHFKLRDSDGFTFTDIDKLRVEIVSIGGLNINMENLFNGDKSLEDSVNSLFNENWRDFFEFLRPAITSAVETVMRDRLTKLFAYVPAKYFIADFPTAASFYA
uniref:Uncharacterized protein n=1 Tax=Stomoxys calcitrans TaxID=35570 RepID=A0A1I8NZD8_STOCA